MTGCFFAIDFQHFVFMSLSYPAALKCSVWLAFGILLIYITTLVGALPPEQTVLAES